MNDRSLAISILQNARDRLSERLTRRVIDAREEIEADADGATYLSEIETIYDELGARLSHVNSMLANLPPAASVTPANATATEIIYADLASGYPSEFETEATSPATMLALPAPTAREQRAKGDGLGEMFRRLAVLVEAGDMQDASRLIGECFDVKPSQARRWALAFGRQVARHPELAARLAELAGAIDDATEQAAAALVAECFESPMVEARSLVRTLKRRAGELDLRK